MFGSLSWKEGLPELPVFGMWFIMPTKAVGYCYEGLSGETYPDRMAGGIYGRYEVEGLPVTPYLVPPGMRDAYGDRMCYGISKGYAE